MDARDGRARARWVCDACASCLERARRARRARGAPGEVSPTPTRRALTKKRHTDARERRDADDERTDDADDDEGGAMKVSFKTLCVRRCVRRRDAATVAR